MSLPKELLDALQVFDGSFESADEAAQRVVSFLAEAKALDSKILHVLVATSLRGGWLMGRRSSGQHADENYGKGNV